MIDIDFIEGSKKKIFTFVFVIIIKFDKSDKFNQFVPYVNIKEKHINTFSILYTFTRKLNKNYK